MSTQGTKSLRNDRHLSLENLKVQIADGAIDTVIVSFTDMQGRLQGKRLHGQYFVDHVLTGGVEGCNYVLAADVEMNPVEGYQMTSWEHGYGDMQFVLDFATIRVLPHLTATVMIQCDLARMDGTPLEQSPRTILRQQIDRAAAAGYTAVSGTELEFIVFDDTYEQAWSSGYRDLTPANQYNVDYSIMGTTRVEPLLHDIRNTMYGAGLDVESAKGECNPGQHEIGFLYADTLTTADNHAVYKNTAKELASQHGKSITFMAKYNQRDGSSGHIHLSLRGENGETVFWDEENGTRTKVYEQFVAGVLATMSDFTLLYAPNINSYKRYVDTSFAPTTVGWGTDNRTCAVRLVGHGSGARLENRVPGADVNPYLALAAMLAGGLHGIEHELELGPELIGNAYASNASRIPRTLRDARDAFAQSEIARKTLGDEVVDHYTNMADVELSSFDRAVTDWELRRGFERL